MIWTQIWDDEWFRKLSAPSRYLFVFLLTNPEVNLIGVYRLNFEKLKYYTKLTDKQLLDCFIEINGKVFYREGWIIIRKYTEFNPYKGTSTDVAKDKEWNLVPSNIKDIVKSTKSYPPLGVGVPPVGGSTNTKTITNTNNIEDVKGITEQDLQDISDKYKVPLSLVKLAKEEMDNWLKAKGKRYSDYKAGLRNWVLRDAKKQIEGRQNGRSRVSIDITKI